MRKLKDRRLYWRGSVIWARVRGEHGHTVRVSTGCRKEPQAVAWADRKETEAADPRHAATNTATLGDAVIEFYAELKRRDRSAATREIAEQKCGHFARVWGESFRLAEIDARCVSAYVDRRLAEGASRLTVRHERAHLRQVLKLARRHGRYDRDVVDVLGTFVVEHAPRERWLSLDEAAALCMALGRRRGAHVAFILATGARRGESFRAQREDVTDDGLVFLRGTKTKKSRRQVPVTAISAAWLAGALASAPGKVGVLFDTWGKMDRDIAAACKRIGIARCSPNDLRRTFATWHRNAGVEPSLIAAMLGHTTDKLVQTTYGRIQGQELGTLIAQRLGTKQAQGDDSASSVTEETASDHGVPPAFLNRGSRVRIAPGAQDSAANGAAVPAADPQNGGVRGTESAQSPIADRIERRTALGSRGDRALGARLARCVRAVVAGDELGWHAAAAPLARRLGGRGATS